MIDRPVVLITGASRGLGRAFAHAFSQKKYAVGLHYHQNESQIRVTSESLVTAGGKTLILKADVRSSVEVNAMMAKLNETWGRVDILVNNAGHVRNRTIFKMTDDEWKDVMAVNLDGPFFVTRAALPMMRAQKSGVIINIVSYIATRGAYGAANYAASKAGLLTLTKNTAIEEGRYNIRANAVLPGFHVTDMNHDVWEKRGEEILSEHLTKKLPDREEMAQFVVSIAELQSVSGQVFAFESRMT